MNHIKLGTVAGVPVGMHWSAAAIVGLTGWLLGAEALPAMVPDQSTTGYGVVAAAGALLFVVSLLAHEFAHALVARRYGIAVRSVTIWAFGGVSVLDGQPPTAGSDLWVAAAGPSTSALVALLLGGVAVATRAFGGPDLIVTRHWAGWR